MNDTTRNDTTRNDTTRNDDTARNDTAGNAQDTSGEPGFRVDPDALAGYARRTRALAEDLVALRDGPLRTPALAGDGFGRIGAESGFAAALDGFGDSLRRQLRWLARDATSVAGAVARTARHHQEQEAEIAQDLTRELLRLSRDNQDHLAM